MARIRTVKPEFFKHGDLYLTEKRTGLPIRLAFAGLWTVVDREGRFKWKPMDIKPDVLPHDPVDFEDVLNALEEDGFIIKYEVGGKEYGCIPSFSEHQNVNSKEAQSKLPAPPGLTPESTEIPMPTPESTEKKTGKGKEGKGKEGEAHTRMRGVRIPEDFPTQEEIKYALQKLKAPPDVVERERQKFRNHYQSEDCKRPVRKDWPATWRNWWLNVSDWSTRSARGQPPPGSEDATMALVKSYQERNQ